MKKNYSIAVILIFAILITSCKNNEKKDDNKAPKSFSVEPITSTVNWIAYKTTSKVAVKGQFTKLVIENPKKGSSALEALNGLKFSIPVNSLFTNDTIRDGKLKKFFFGAMNQSDHITGSLHMNNETSGTADIVMNGISQVMPITYVISDQMVTIEAVMDLDNWQAQLALESLNAVCKELHSGEDGIAMTWSEVKIEIATYLKFE